jgi:hypothetical protein
VPRQRDEAVSDISRRQNAELFAKASRTASVIAHRHDRSERVEIDRWMREVHETSQHDRQAGPAAERDDALFADAVTTFGPDAASSSRTDRRRNDLSRDRHRIRPRQSECPAKSVKTSRFFVGGKMLSAEQMTNVSVIGADYAYVQICESVYGV